MKTSQKPEISLLGGGARDRNLAKAISLGVSPHSPWDLEMANLGYKVIEYDASIENSPYNHENITFFKNFVGSKTDGDFVSLEDVIEKNNLNENYQNILQIDIENAEWEILANIDINLISSYFTQVIFEFHGCNPCELDEALFRFKILEKLNAKFTPIHAHFNNHGKIFYSRGLFFSSTFEVSYLRNDVAQNLKITKRRKNGVLSGLDFPTFPFNPEIPLRFEF